MGGKSIYGDKMDILKSIGKKKSKEFDVMKRFAKLIEGKTKEEIRKIEYSLLKPETLPPYMGKTTAQTEHQKRTVAFTFKTQKDVQKLSSHFQVLTYQGNNLHKTDWLMEIVRLLDIGAMEWREETKSFHILNKNLFKKKRKLKRRK